MTRHPFHSLQNSQNKCQNPRLLTAVTTAVQYAYEMRENLAAELVWLTHCFMVMHRGRRSQCVYRKSTIYIWFAIFITIIFWDLSNIGVSFICDTNLFGDSSQVRAKDNGITCCYWSASLSNQLRALKVHSSLLKCCAKNRPNYMYWIQGKHRGSWVWVFLRLSVSLKLIFIVPFNFYSISLFS